ncbi:MAG: hypothetical protein M1830_007889 [Pleopsidium flavum]|nr:MAG: hypothetical protein M1830_007889 [Pleopsidium flavum]
MSYRLREMTFGIVFVSIVWLLYTSHAESTQSSLASHEQHVLSSDEPAKRVAIIGAGSGGASTAYYLSKYASEWGLKTNVTVYERSAYVGGRSTTINVYDDLFEPVELGASIFVKANKNLVSAAEEFGLLTDSIGDTRPNEAPEKLGVWDGKKFVFTQSDGGYYWWNIAKLIWKYGLAPVRTQNLMKETVGKFLKMYEEPHFPFRSLSQVTNDLGLTVVTGATGEQLLKEHNIGSPFSTDIIQASTRVNYGQNLGLIHGLETMVCMATDGAMAVKGGNWKIFDEMLKAASAHVQLNTRVVEVHRNDDKTYALMSATGKITGEVIEQVTDEFDTVIIAAPLQFSDINLSPSLSNPPDKIPYVKLQVTLFVSPHKLSPTAFHLPADAAVPEVVLTTVPSNKGTGQREDGVGPAGFFSISTLRTINNPSAKSQRTEYLYKVFSPEPLTSTFLSRILGISDPELDLSCIPKKDISWLYEKEWYSYPYLYPRVTFDDPQLDWNLWYTSGIESFISTMETSSLMGMNVARLVVNDWMGVMQLEPAPEFDSFRVELH